MTGYSGTALIKKLGITDEMKLLILNPPGGIDAYWELISADCSAQLCKPKERPGFIHLFAASQKEFLKCYKQIEKRLSGNVSFWVSWYKKSASIPTDLTEDWIRQFALANNLVDVKVCAVTEQWSGLKLVIPVAKR
ncbi:hypothetical protein WG954_01020 [Lacibacter sp. H375]|uniref:hypothetical protein n=1 Tax=Lacibacter sp. H375 TaxID=3133424 RepID=UPI0030BAA243